MDINSLYKILYGNIMSVTMNRGIEPVLNDIVVDHLGSKFDKYHIKINKAVPDFVGGKSIVISYTLYYPTYGEGRVSNGTALPSSYDEVISIPVNEFMMRWRDKQLESIGIFLYFLMNGGQDN